MMASMLHSSSAARTPPTAQTAVLLLETVLLPGYDGGLRHEGVEVVVVRETEELLVPS